MKKKWIDQVLLLTLAAAVRFWFVQEHPSDLYLKGEMAYYEREALQLLSGESGPWDTFLPIGYPAFLAAIYSISGGIRHDVVDNVQALLGALTCVLAHAVAIRAGSSARTARVVGLTLAVYPPLVLYTGFLLTETLFAFLVTAFAWCVLRALEVPRLRNIALAAFVFGIGSFVRSNLLATIPLLLIWAWRARSHVPHAIKTILLTLALAIPIMLPVVVRNSMLVGHPVGLSTNGGVNFFLSRCECRGVLFPENEVSGGTTAYHNRIRYTEMWQGSFPPYEESYYYAEGIRLVIDDPWLIMRGFANVQDGLGLGPLNEPAYWPSWMGHNDILNTCARIIAPLTLLPTLIVAVLQRKRMRKTDKKDGRWVLLTIVISELFTMNLYLGDPRGRVPFDPLLIILGTMAWADLGRWMAQQIASRRKVTHVNKGTSA
jgi:4-amino-4-deoxy-L-arabinose transferase-like glycosyltransferase